jgi:Mycobacterium 19 kDa lipoprotein antigen
MRSIGRLPTGQPVLTAGAALLVALVGCSSEPAQDTKVVFDGQTYTIHASVTCAMGRDGKLGVIATTERGKKLIAVRLSRDYPLVVQSVGFRHFDVRGFTNNPDLAWATKVDNTYTISGRMPPDDGEPAWHQFKIDVTCLAINEYTPDQRGTRIRVPPGF